MVQMHEELQLLARMMKKHLEAHTIQDLISKMRFLKIDWKNDTQVYSEQEMPPRRDKDENASRSSKETLVPHGEDDPEE